MCKKNSNNPFLYLFIALGSTYLTRTQFKKCHKCWIVRECYAKKRKMRKKKIQQSPGRAQSCIRAREYTHFS